MAARRANDLTAEANRAARDANAIGAQTLIWTWRGFIAVVLTLIATAWAAWGAARAAAIANKSLDLFQAAEGALLAPKIALAAMNLAINVAAVNRGRTPAFVIHADLIFRNEPFEGPLPMILSGKFKADQLVAEGASYDFGNIGFDGCGRQFYALGGIIYKTSFGRCRVAKISALIDRETGTFEVVHDTDFRKWEMFVGRIDKGKKIKKGMM